MKIEVLEEKENPLLDRKEIVARIVHDDSTPSRDVVRSKAIAKLKAKKDTFILDSMKTKFGAKESIARMRIYGSKKRVLEIESEHVLKKNLLISQEDKKKEEKKEKPAKEEKGKGEEEKPKVEKKKPQKEGAKEEPVKEEKAEGAEKEKSDIKGKKPKKGETKKGEESKEKEETSAKKDKTKEE
ncbi:MAG: hypothetical protein ACE5J5_05580 [Candidatus Hydrothermarchaeales archaeon]